MKKTYTIGLMGIALMLAGCMAVNSSLTNNVQSGTNRSIASSAESSTNDVSLANDGGGLSGNETDVAR